MSTNLGSKSLLRSRRKCENFSKINFVMIIGRGPTIEKHLSELRLGEVVMVESVGA